jgi:uncharacterized protein (DUF305 family)
MDTKPLLFGIIGFIAGGLLVSTVATTIEKPTADTGGHDSMSSMVAELQGQRGDDFDKAFIEGMIVHHQGAIDMAELAEGQAKHREIKDLSKAVIEAQSKEIEEMRHWQQDWGYVSGGDSHGH